MNSRLPACTARLESNHARLSRGIRSFSLCSRLLRCSLRLVRGTGPGRSVRCFLDFAFALVLRRAPPLPLLSCSSLAEVLLSHPCQSLGVRLSVLAAASRHGESIAREARGRRKPNNTTAMASTGHEPTRRPGSRSRPENGLSRRTQGPANQAADAPQPACAATGVSRNTLADCAEWACCSDNDNAPLTVCAGRVSAPSAAAPERAARVSAGYKARPPPAGTRLRAERTLPRRSGGLWLVAVLTVVLV